MLFEKEYSALVLAVYACLVVFFASIDMVAEGVEKTNRDIVDLFDVLHLRPHLDHLFLLLQAFDDLIQVASLVHHIIIFA